MDTVIREAKIEDAGGIARVHVKTWQCAYRGQVSNEYLDKLSVEKRTKTWEENLKNPKDRVRTFVAELNGKIVGFASGGALRDTSYKGSNTGELWAIYVDGDEMGKGIGSSLYEKCIEYLKSLGFTKAILWVLTSNKDTRKWYEKRGWETDGKTITDQMDGLSLQVTLYAKDL